MVGVHCVLLIFMASADQRHIVAVVATITIIVCRHQRYYPILVAVVISVVGVSAAGPPN